MHRGLLVLALVVQVLAQTFGGVWGAAIGGVAIGTLCVLRGAGGGFRTGFLAAAAATALLLAMLGVRGGDIVPFASRLGANFQLPGWGLLAVTLLLPAVQSGALAGAISRLRSR